MDFWSFFWGFVVASVIFYMRKQYYIAEVLHYPLSALNSYDDDVDKYCNEVAQFLRARLKGTEWGIEKNDDWSDITELVEQHHILNELPKDAVNQLMDIHNAQYMTGSYWLPLFLRVLHAAGCTMVIKQSETLDEAPVHVPQSSLRRVLFRSKYHK